MGEEDEKEETEDPQSALHEIADWYAKSKKTLSERAEQHGEEEELMRTLGDTWPYVEDIMKDLDPLVPANYAGQIRWSAQWFRSRDPTNLASWAQDDPIILSKSLSSSGSAATYGAIWQYDIRAPERVAQFLQAPARDKETRHLVQSALSKLSKSIASRFDDAWRILHTGEEGATHTALMAMREAVDHTVKHLSRPGQRFQGSYAEQRQSRVEWIAANLVSDPLKRKNLLDARHVYQRLYRDLSEFGKKRGPIPQDLAKKLLIQGQDYIHLLLDACGLAN